MKNLIWLFVANGLVTYTLMGLVCVTTPKACDCPFRGRATDKVAFRVIEPFHDLQPILAVGLGARRVERSAPCFVLLEQTEAVPALYDGGIGEEVAVYVARAADIGCAGLFAVSVGGICVGGGFVGQVVGAGGVEEVEG